MIKVNYYMWWMVGVNLCAVMVLVLLLDKGVPPHLAEHGWNLAFTSFMFTLFTWIAALLTAFQLQFWFNIDSLFSLDEAEDHWLSGAMVVLGFVSPSLWIFFPLMIPAALFRFGQWVYNNLKPSNDGHN